jgi:hypothetical protein
MTQHAPPLGPQDRPSRDTGETTQIIPQARTAQRDDVSAHEVSVTLAAAQLGVSIWMACEQDGHRHAVTDPAFVAGCESGQGTYHAVCDHVITPIPASGARCGPCEHWLQDRARDQPEPHWMRWVHPLIAPTDAADRNGKSVVHGAHLPAYEPDSDD